MASIRHVRFGKETLIWFTGKTPYMYYKSEEVTDMYENEIKPKLKINNPTELRKSVYDLVKNAISSGIGMHQFASLIVALRQTEIDITQTDNDGNFIISRVKYNTEGIHQEYERRTFHNMMFHMNRHCRQLWKCCFVRVRYLSPYGHYLERNTAFTGKKEDDNCFADFLDDRDLYKESNDYKKKYGKNPWE